MNNGRRIVSQALRVGVAPCLDGPGHDVAAHHTTMKPITVWEKWEGPRRDQHLEHNHIEDGHTDRLFPLPKTPEQKAAWHGQTWVRTHAYLDEHNRVISAEVQ